MPILRSVLIVFVAIAMTLSSTSSTAPTQPPPVIAAVETEAVLFDDKEQMPSTTTTSTVPPPAPTTTSTLPPAPPETTVPSSVPEASPAASGSHTAVIQSVFAPYGQDAVATALRVAECESAPDYATALSASGTYAGLFQIGNFWADEFLTHTGTNYYDGRFNPWANATFAAWLAYEAPGGGWSHWSCY